MTDRSTELLNRLALPFALNAQTWLIVGADDHGWSDALAQRGAAVTHANWDDLSALADARFEVTLALRLFEGIRHPLLALEYLCALTRNGAFLQAPLHRLPDDRARLCWQVEGWQTNRTALARMARSAGFAQVKLVVETPEGFWIKAERRWNDYPAGVTPTLTITHAFNPVTGASQFPRSGPRAFLALVVAGLPTNTRRWELRVRIGTFGIQPIYVGDAETPGCKQINVPVPPGLFSGGYSIEVWQRQALSNKYLIEID